jgi:hypothetical protein
LLVMDGVLVAIPWRDTDEHRRAALAWITACWRRLGIEPVLGTTDTNKWCKAEAIRRAIADRPSRILIIADADCWSDDIPEAINRVCNGAPWVIPHHKVHRLTPEATTDVLAGRQPHEGMPLDRSFGPDIPGIAYVGVAGGGIVVCSRDVYDQCPLDPRFVGWGQEDEAWGLALRCLYGPPVRLSAPLWHLWHPPQPRLNRGTGSEAGMALYRRYSKAKRRPDEMRALIEEGRHAHAPS